MRGRSGARVLNETRVRVARFGGGKGGFSARLHFDWRYRARNIDKKFKI